MDEDRAVPKNARPPTDRPRRAAVKARSLVLVNTGDGKGKTTAALGTALRAVARGWSVCVIQFIKSGRWKVGEETVARRLGIEWWSIGDGFTWDSGDMDRTQAVAREAWRVAAEKIGSNEHRLVVLDEITYAINWGWVPIQDVLEVLAHRPPDVSVIVTGRDAAPELVEIADTVTEMQARKHAFDRGVRAIRGLDF
jgi:cob(I)alamin adenosyltransferase